jgi:hypothetical protein
MQRWENPEIRKVSGQQEYGTPKMLFFGIMSLWFFFLTFGFSNTPNYR